MDPFQRYIRQRMNDLRILTYAELGRRAGFSRATAHTLVTQPRRGMPEPNTLKALAKALQTTYDELVKVAEQALDERESAPRIRRGDRMVPVVGDIEGMSDLDLLELQEAINSEQRRRHERDRS